MGNPRYHHIPAFEGLAQGIEDIPLELGELVEKEDPVVGEADLPRTGKGAPSDKTRRPIWYGEAP